MVTKRNDNSRILVEPEGGISLMQVTCDVVRRHREPNRRPYEIRQNRVSGGAEASTNECISNEHESVFKNPRLTATRARE